MLNQIDNGFATKNHKNVTSCDSIFLNYFVNNDTLLLHLH
jgi:hypothetical protein